MSPTLQKHLDAIRAKAVTKSNVIGLRKALNAWDRASRGYSVSSTSPRMSDGDADAIVKALFASRPRVSGELHDSGLALLRSKRYARRWTPAQALAIETLDHFRLAGFEDVGSLGLSCFVPVYEVWARDSLGSMGPAFQFRNIPWQSGGNGPQIVTGY